MEFVFKDLRDSPVWVWLPFALAGLLVAAICFNAGLAPEAQGLLAVGAFSLLTLFLGPCLLKAAHADHRHLLTVCVWSCLWLLAGIAAAFFAFFRIAGGDFIKYDKILNVVPVGVAIWAAAVGWLIHFKLTSKAHRTNNAFAIIMETRKSSEFLKRAELVSRHFPAGSTQIPEEYRQYFAPDSVKKLVAQSPGDSAAIERAEAVVALKYVLNYYEFMAVGIRAGDLDEQMIYDTISTTVVKQFDRAKALVEYTGITDNPGGNQFTYCELRALVAKWKSREAQQIADQMTPRREGS